MELTPDTQASPGPEALPLPEARRLANAQDALAAAHALAARAAPGAVARDRDRLLPWAELEVFSASGLGAISVPAEHGGAGVGASTLADVIAVLARADGSLGQIPQNHFYALEVLRVGGTPGQQALIHEQVLRGARLGNALAEVGHKDFQRRTRLHRADGSAPRGDPARNDERLYVSGRKFYCTGALYAHWIPTLVVSPDDPRRSWLAFIPAGSPGVTITDDWDGFGQRVTGSGSVSFDQVLVRPEWIVPFSDSFVRATTIGPVAQIMHAAIDLGIGWSAWDDMLQGIRERARPWIDAGVHEARQDPLTIQQVGEVSIRLRAAQALLRRAGRITETAQAAPSEATVAAASVAVAEARVLTTTASLLASNALFELSGTSSTLDELGLDRHWRNARTHTLHDPVRWKYHAVGNYYLNDTFPPRHGAL
ncbi:Acyl-CoA dehydrogenase; probable dibenzothiophene desulfurization enzyme [plant metagenome]